MADVVAFIDLAPEVDGRLREMGVSLEQVVQQSGIEANVIYGSTLMDGDDARAKSLLPVIIAASTGLSVIILTLTNLLDTYLHRPHYAEWDELELVMENCIALRDTAGNPVWKVAHRQGLVEARPKKIVNDLEFSASPEAIVVRLHSSSDEKGEQN